MPAPIVVTKSGFISSIVNSAIGVKSLVSGAYKAGGIKGVLVALAKAVGGAILKVLSFTAIVQWVQQAGVFLYNFNWSMTDEEIDQQLQSNLNQLASLSGAAAGRTLGWAVCGAVPGAMIAVINPVAGAMVLKNVGEQGLEEVVSAWVGLLKSAVSIGFRGFVLWGFKNLRRWLKSPGNAIAKAIFGEEFLKKWGEKGQPVLSLAKFVEDRIESIPNATIRAFVESAYEEFWEACAEASFVVANSLDAFLALQRQSRREEIIGKERIVEITPDRSVPAQKIVLAGNERTLMPAISSIITTHQLLDQKDVGQIVGSPVEEYYQRKPGDLELIVKFYSSQTPPLSRTNLVQATYKVPEVLRSKLDWEKIKAACGGSAGFMYGPCRMTCHLDTGSNMAIYAASHLEAEQLLDRLLSLSQAEKTYCVEGKEVDGGNRSAADGNLKKIVKLYPYSATVIHARKTADPALGRKRLSDGERVVYRKAVFPLWTDSKPPNFDALINDLFT